MHNKMIMGQFIAANSYLHRLDPRTKLLSLLIIMLSFLLLQSFLSYVTATVFVGVVLLTSKIPIMRLAGSIKPLLLVLVFTFLYHALLNGNTVVWSWLFLKLTKEGMVNGAQIVWRIILLVLIASVLTASTKPLILAQGIQKLLKPLNKLGVRTEAFSLMVMMTMRFIPTIMMELDRIILAQQARGYDVRSLPRMKQVFAYIPILIPLFASTIGRAEQLTYAIDARAYGLSTERTSYRPLEFQRTDFTACAYTFLFVCVLLFIRMYN